jgi:hypothetical protein
LALRALVTISVRVSEGPISIKFLNVKSLEKKVSSFDPADRRYELISKKLDEGDVSDLLSYIPEKCLMSWPQSYGYIFQQVCQALFVQHESFWGSTYGGFVSNDSGEKILYTCVEWLDAWVRMDRDVDPW